MKRTHKFFSRISDTRIGNVVRRSHIWLPTGVLTFLVAAQCLDQSSKIAQAQENEPQPVPMVEAEGSASPTPTPYPGFPTPPPRWNWSSGGRQGHIDFNDSGFNFFLDDPDERWSLNLRLPIDGNVSGGGSYTSGTGTVTVTEVLNGAPQITYGVGGGGLFAGSELQYRSGDAMNGNVSINSGDRRFTFGDIYLPVNGRIRGIGIAVSYNSITTR